MNLGGIYKIKADSLNDEVKEDAYFEYMVRNSQAARNERLMEGDWLGMENKTSQIVLSPSCSLIYFSACLIDVYLLRRDDTTILNSSGRIEEYRSRQTFRMCPYKYAGSE